MPSELPAVSADSRTKIPWYLVPPRDPAQSGTGYLSILLAEGNPVNQDVMARMRAFSVYKNKKIIKILEFHKIINFSLCYVNPVNIE